MFDTLGIQEKLKPNIYCSPKGIPNIGKYLKHLGRLKFNPRIKTDIFSNDFD